jgi:hypothetical protein
MLNLPPDMTVAQINQMLEEQKKAKARAKYERNREAQLARLKQWREANHEEVLQKKREYREAHRDELAQKNREYRLRKKIQEGVIPGGLTFPQEKNILVT